MSTIPTTISTDPVLRVEQLFVELLTADPRLAGLIIVAASDRSAIVPPEHVFVYCTRAVPITNAGQNYRCDVTIASVSNIDDTTDAVRRANFKLVLKGLSRVETFARADATLLGWPIADINEASTDQQAANTVRLRVAAYVAG